MKTDTTCLTKFLLGREEVDFDIDIISPYYKDKIVFVTGAGGSIGSEIINQLLQLPIKQVIGMGHGENSIYELMNRIDDKRFVHVIGDIRDKNKMNYELKKFKPDIFFHAAAHKHVPLMEEFPDEAIKNNILGTYNCSRLCIKNKVKKFMLISTDKAVRPTSVMGTTKRIAERIVLAFNEIQKCTVFSLTRFGNVLCSRGSVIPRFKQLIEEGKPIFITHREMKRFFMSIPEAAKLVIKSATIEEGNTFVLEMGEQVKIMDIAKKLYEKYGNGEGLNIIFTGLRPGEKLYEELIINPDNVVKTQFEKLLILKQADNILNGVELVNMIQDFIDVIDAEDGYDYNKIRVLLKEHVPEASLEVQL